MGGALCSHELVHTAVPTRLLVFDSRLQAAARQGAEAVSVRLGALSRPSQAQLDGFKSRVLRVNAKRTQPRDLYATEWRHIDVVSSSGASVLVVGDGESVGCERFSARASSVELATKLSSGKWDAIAVRAQGVRGQKIKAKAKECSALSCRYRAA